MTADESDFYGVKMTADERDFYMRELDRLVDEIDYGEPDDDETLKIWQTKSMFIPKFLKRKLNENLELKITKITRQRLFE
jgi:hypothetical protein